MMRLAIGLALLAGLAGPQVIIRPDVPALNTLAPTSGLVGSSVVLTGINFGPAQENSLVTFNGAPAVTIAWSNTSITALVPPAGTTGPVVVVRGGVSTVGLPFTVLAPPPPVLTSLSVLTGPVGTPVTLTGTNFGATQGASVVTFNGTVATPTSWSATSIATTVPAGTTTGPVHVVVLGQTSNNLTFTVTVAPVLTSLNFNTGPVGTSVILTGLHFGAVQNSSLVFFNGVPATSYPAWSDTSVTTAVPTGATSGPVTILVLGVTSNGITFTVTTGGNTFVAATCNWQDVMNARIAAFNATGGTSPATVIIPPGTCTDWPPHGPMFLNNDETLQGAGGTATTIDLTGATDLRTIDIYNVSARVTGIQFICAQMSLGGAGWRIDHNTFTCSQSWSTFGAAVYAYNLNKPGGATAPLSGLVDHNTFLHQRVFVARFASSTLGEAAGSTAWSEPFGLGGSNAVYVEDNTFSAISGDAINAVDCQYSGEYVFRFNIVHDLYVEAHSARSASRACRKWEVYNNMFDNKEVGSGFEVFFMRGGSGVMFNNTWTGHFGNNTGALDNIRDYFSDGLAWMLCDGTSPWDGNTAGRTGWPCLDQLGRSTDNLGPFNATPPPYSPPPQTSDPAYFWHNQIHVLPTDPLVDVPVAIVNGSATAGHLVQGRDYFVSASTAKPSYTPYFYPHPLQGIPAPTLASLSVLTGPVGTTVTLTGTNFLATQAQSTVTFNGVTATPSAWSATSITVTVPVGATTGQVRVTVGAGVSGGIQFTVT